MKKEVELFIEELFGVEDWEKSVEIVSKGKKSKIGLLEWSKVCVEQRV